MNKFCKILLAAAAVTALAAPAMAADKLIVKDALGTSDVFKVDDAGQIILPKTGTGKGVTFKNAAIQDNFPSVAALPDGSTANQGISYQIIPRGTGFSAALKAQLTVFGTDLIADSVNYEAFVLRATGSAYSINSTKGGTGIVRPIQFQISNQAKMTIDTTGYVGIATTTPTSQLAVVGLPTFANNAAALAGPPVLKAGDFYKTSTGQVMVVY